MAWKGFLRESKRFMGYPALINTESAWCPARFADMNADERKRAIRFWLQFPLAWLRFFIVFPLRDAIRRGIV